MRRRQFLRAVIAPLAAPALIGLTRKSPFPLAGGFVDDGGAAGHRLRDRRGPVPTPRERRRLPIVIVGGGMAGLCAGWQLQRQGMKDFVILEMERAAGGNSRSGENDISAFPWAAHYVPVPDPKATLVREMFEEFGVLRDGKWEERYLCFTPQERLFLHGAWRAGIEPEFGTDARTRADFATFDARIAELRATGQFTIPLARGATPGSPLDRLTMADWLTGQGLTSPALRWYVDYACRDDFGALAAETSAWAGVHYFASREHEEAGPLTWPEGNGWIAKRLIRALQSRIRTDEPALQIERSGNAWQVVTARATYVADTVIFAAPTFLLPWLNPSMASRRIPLVYSPWMTANLTLDRRPSERRPGAPPSWDNVIYGSPSLGYVDATHQSLKTFQDRAVWTYYWALAELTPTDGRKLLQTRTWSEWTALILADLERVHPDIRACVSRIDIMRMGHAMVRPTVGFLAATDEVRRQSEPGLFLANSDLSGLSLFEEAQYRGVTAAQAALRLIGGRR